MNKSLTTIALCSILAVTACNSNSSKNTQQQDSTGHHHNHNDGHNHAHPDEHTSQNSVDWMGTYKGTVPCADCPGIETEVKLYQDETFSYKATYQDRNLTVADTGKFMWHDNGSVVHLKGKDTDTKYKVGENILIQLDTEGKEITGTLTENYKLKKAQQ